MIHYFSKSTQKKFKSRHRHTLPITINKDLRRAQQHRDIKNKFQINSFTDINDLDKLTTIATDRNKWKDLCKEVHEAAQAEKFQN